MSTTLNFGRDVQGYNAYAPAPAVDQFSVQLLSGGNSSFTVPSSAPIWIVSFSHQPGATIWVAYDNTASPPAGNTFAATTSEQNPGSRTLAGGTVVNCYNNGTADASVSVSLYVNA